MHWKIKKTYLLIFIDVKKAFDNINPAILLKKLERYGIRGAVGNWVKSYLSHRLQYVQMSESSSDCRVISHGVPQGSVLGPKLFHLYINDIVFNVSQLLKCVLFSIVMTIMISWNYIIKYKTKLEKIIEIDRIQI